MSSQHKPNAADEEDVDDLNGGFVSAAPCDSGRELLADCSCSDVLDEMTTGGPSKAGASTSSAPAASSSKATPAAETSTAAGQSGSASNTATTVTDDDQDAAFNEEDLLSEDFANQFAKGMQALLQGIPGAAGGSAAGDTAAEGKGGDGAGGEGSLNEEELMKQFERMLFASASQQTDGTSPSTAAAPTATSGSSVSAPRSSTSGAATAGQPGGNFQNAISATMAKLKQSDATASSSTATGGEQDAMMQMLAALSGGGEGGGAGGPDGMPNMEDLMKMLAAGEGGEGGDGAGGAGEEGLAKMLETMMDELMSKAVLFEPLQEMEQKYGPYLTSEEFRKLPASDQESYPRQAKVVSEILKVFQDPKSDESKNTTDPKQKERRTQVTNLMNDMQECGAPPDEIVGDLPPELEGFAGMGKGGPTEDCCVM